MLVKNIEDCKGIIAGDNCFLKEIISDKDVKNLGYSLARAVVSPGEVTYKHALKTSSEVYFIVQGEGTMYIDDEERDVSAGDVIYIPPGAVQRIRNIGKEDLVFYCIVKPSWKSDDEVVFN